MRGFVKVAIQAALVASALVVAYPAKALFANYEATVTRVLASNNEAFGGCMLMLSPSPSTQNMLACPASGWTTADCSALLPGSTKDAAIRKFEVGQLAFALGREVRVRVDDQKKLNGNCYLEQIQLLAPTP